MKRCLITICFAVLALGAALAQDKKAAPTPPSPSEKGPSLESTMAFVQDKVNGIGKVGYAQTQTTTETGEVSNTSASHTVHVSAAPASCDLTWDHVWRVGGQLLPTATVTVHLKEVQRVEVMTVEEWDNRSFGESAKETISPPTPYELKAFFPGGGKLRNVQFYFFDQEMADRVAKAMVHAVELCGGGSPPEPF
jgi:hypothetical protein